MKPRGARQERSDIAFERGAGAAELRRGRGQARRIEPRGGEHRRRRAQPCPRETRVAIARILDPVLAGGGEGRGEARARHGEHRPEDAAERPLDRGGCAGKPVEPAAARQAQEERLGLVLALMGGEEMQHRGALAPRLEEARSAPRAPAPARRRQRRRRRAPEPRARWRAP